MQNWQQAFSAIGGRDAWSTIRGYVYQVDLTILRWFDLADNDVLELERGEDIDIVHRDITGEEISRELEQLKFREANLTLNNAEVIKILKNFYLHKRNNPAKQLLFRFVTNTAYSSERPAIFSGEKGIDAWRRLAALPLLDPQHPDLKIIRQQLQLVVNKQLVPLTDQLSDTEKNEQQDWRDFSTYLDDEAEMVVFIKNFEWSFSRENQDQVTNNVRLRIAQDFEMEETDAIYARLFLHLFKLLSNSGLKQVDKPSLDRICTLPTISAADQQLLDILKNLLGSLTARLSALEKHQAEQDSTMQALVADIGILQHQAIVDFRTQHISVSPPSPLLQGSKRAVKATAIKDLLDKHSWVSFLGINGCGKTQLAALVCQQYQDVFWLDLREFNEDADRCLVTLMIFLQSISGISIKNKVAEWLTEVCAALPQNALLVINDLPMLSAEKPVIAGLIIELGKATGSAGVHLLTTGNHPLPDAVTDALLQDTVTSYSDFDFTDDEIKECLSAYTAPQQIIDLAPLIALKAKRNSRLVMSMIHRLQALNWGSSENIVIDILLDNEFSAPILADVQASISRYVTDDRSRELLYRLSLINWKFGSREIDAVSNIPDNIDHPFEKLQPLLDTWIQRNGTSVYEVSPLAYQIGQQNLPVDLIKQVNIALGRSLLHGTVDQSAALRAIFCFLRGDDHNAAGSLLLNVYMSAHTSQEAANLDAWGFLDFWTQNGLVMSPRMSGGLRALIRVQQLRLYQLVNKSEDQLLQLLNNELSDPGLSVSETVVARFLLIPQIANRYIDLYFDHLEFVVQHWQRVEDAYKPELSDELFAGLLWIGLPELIALADFVKWIAIGVQMRQLVGIAPFQNAIATDAISALCIRILKYQPDQGPKESTSDKIRKLETLEAAFKADGETVLAAIVASAIIRTEFQVYADPANADQMTRQLINDSNSVAAQYILADNLGQLYYHDKGFSRAKSWLEQALAYDQTALDGYIETLVFAAATVSADDPQAALAYCERGWHLAKGKGDIDELDYIAISAELTLAYWIIRDLPSMLERLEELVDRLYIIRGIEPSKEWIRLFQLSGHVAGYIAAMLVDNRIPQTHDGDYFTPFQGMFYTSARDISDLYNPKNDAMLGSQVAFAAAGAHRIDRAYVWTVKSLDLARSAGSIEAADLIQRVSAQYTVAYFRPREALDAYLYSGAASALVTGTPEERKEKLQQMDVPELLKAKPSPVWDSAEDTAVQMAVIPLFLMVLTALLDNRSEKNRMKDEYLTLLKDYQLNASSRLLWELMHEISNDIIERNTTVERLRGRANTFGQQDRRHLQITCIIGVSYLSDDAQERVAALVNVMPYLRKLSSVTKSIIEYSLAPFVIACCRSIWLQMNVGDSAAQIELLDQADITDDHVMQTALRPLAEILNPELAEDRQDWLYRLKDI